MLSILIPVYNYNTYNLVQEIYTQAVSLQITFEIRVYDDGSDQIEPENLTISNLPYCIFKPLPYNIGRSAIRNLLAKEAVYETLLFIDAGTFPRDPNYIQKYIEHINTTVVTGGMNCLPKKPKKPYILRWLYTQKREMFDPNREHQKVVCSSNFLIKKEVFATVKFDETLKKYGCEDVIFFDTILQNGWSINTIDNPVIHDAKDDTYTFLQKTESALENLNHLILAGKISKDRYRISAAFYKLEKYKLTPILYRIFTIIKPLLRIHLNSSYPTIIGYDCYRLGYFCTVKHKK